MMLQKHLSNSWKTRLPNGLQGVDIQQDLATQAVALGTRHVYWVPVCILWICNIAYLVILQNQPLNTKKYRFEFP